MRIRTFTADSAREAIDRVRAEMGADAVIIALDEAANGRGVIVRAAMEGDPPEIASAEPTEPVSAMIEPERRLERLLLARLNAWPLERLSGANA